MVTDYLISKIFTPFQNNKMLYRIFEKGI